MFTPISKKYCKEPSLRYSSKDLCIAKTGLRKSGGRDRFGPVCRRSGSFNDGFFSGPESRFNPVSKAKEGSEMPSALFERNGLSTLQKGPLTCSSRSNTKYWAELAQHQQEHSLEEKGLKYATREGVRNSHSRGTGWNYFDPCIDRSVREQQKGYGNQLLTLRAELSEKELQLVEIQQQHNKLICRSTDAFKRLEVAIKTKDQVIWQLHQALQNKQNDLERHDKLFDEEKQVLLQKTQEKNNIELEEKDTEITLLRARSASQIQELHRQEEIIGSMKQELQEKDNNALPPQHMLNKMDALIAQVQSLESSLQNKEVELESQKKLCNELKTLVWKRECMIGQLQVTEQQLQTSLMRQTEAYNSLENFNEKLQAEKLQTQKNLNELKEVETLGSAPAEDQQLKEDLKVQEAILQNQRRQIHEIQRALHAKDAALNSQSRKFQLQHEENQKLIEDYEMLKQEYAALKQEKNQLDLSLANLDALVTAKKQYSMNQDIIEISVQDEKDRINTPTNATNNTENRFKSPEQNRTVAGVDSELLSIEEEIGKREKEWRQTEAKMRAELCRRIAQLNELENYRPESKQEKTSGKLDGTTRSQFSDHVHKKRSQPSPFCF
ncbi:hypothetical protein SELMODRAFT_403262 [Selaginella moellendorffii]|uniref:Uncharacterized protein n=1 Tax=Selaginella moellendorffii TaxID=88036 RepID=D8QTL4_SELML|nr:hypothetical protein SELMODRAFT_403262 [Selaginella moellendorffii]